MDWLDVVRKSFELGSVYVTRHAREEMEREEFGEIATFELVEAVGNMELIEEYPDDKPYASALILGTTDDNRPIHFVCAYDRDTETTTVVTVYQPDPGRWINFRKRKSL